LRITHRILFSNQDLRRQLRDAETQAWENGQAKDRELQDLGRRLREAESLAQQAQPKLAARDREIQQLSREMQEKDEEVNGVRCLYHDVIMMSRHDVL